MLTVKIYCVIRMIRFIQRDKYSAFYVHSNLLKQYPVNMEISPVVKTQPTSCGLQMHRFRPHAFVNFLKSLGCRTAVRLFLF